MLNISYAEAAKNTVRIAELQ